MGCEYRPDKFQIGNIIAFVLNILITYLGGVATVFGGSTNGDISKKFTTLVSPAGYAFSIWSVIFVTEGIFTVWQAFPARTGSVLLHQTISYWWMAACSAQCCWALVFAHELIWLASVLLAAIAGCLGGLYVNLDALRPHIVTNSDEDECSRVLTWWIVVFPFSTHFAWALCAAVVNFNLGIVSSDASVDAQYWIGMSSVSLLAVAVAVLSWFPRQDPVGTLVGAWALAAIASKLQGSSGRLRQDDKEVVFSTDSLQACATALFVLAGILGLVGLGLVVLSGWRCWGRGSKAIPAKDEDLEEDSCQLQTKDRLSQDHVERL
eukprot:TRINITY_DN1438_c0_g1_i1.p1 TRINITY_DN1438_c0_g1~~TRINITY_DN1438_c0_g1_i1.p1  ORF type:complete len:321 (+),score=47.53 TRINITY_DN1438_c0_g1_i1:145-1107(+)